MLAMLGCSADHLGSLTGHGPLEGEPIPLGRFPFPVVNLPLVKDLQHPL